MPPDNLFDDLLFTSTGNAIEAVTEWESKSRDIRRRFELMLGAGPCGARPSPNVTICSEIFCDNFVRREIEFSVHDNERAHAYIHIPTSLVAEAPAVLCLQQTAPHDREVIMGVTDDSASLAYGKELAHRGFVTFCADHFNAGKRIPGEGAFDTSEFYRRFPNWSAVGKSLWEAQIALDILCDMDEVDAQRIGCMGHSLGGHGASFLAFYDSRIRCAVANCGNTSFRGNSGRMLWSRDEWYIYFPMLRALFLQGKSAPVDFHEIIAGVAPRAFLDISTLDEPAFDGQDCLPSMFLKIHEVYKLYGCPEKFANYMHNAGHGLFHHSTQLAYAWLETWLG